jgi:hypothetical protein
MARARIGTCSGPAEAALVRAAFEAHGVPIVINAEQHASVLGGLGGALVPLHIYVDDERAEEAAALLEDLRGADRAADEEPLPDGEAADEADEAGAEEVAVRAEQRRRAVAVLLLGCCLTFGTAHMSTGAWLRGLALAGLQVLAISYLVAGQRAEGFALLAACVAADVIGAMWRIRTAAPRLPRAHVRR